MARASSTAASPSLPSEAVAKVLRGGRKMAVDSKVTLSENGLEDMDQFWGSAKTPKPAVPKKQTKKRKPLKQDNRKKKQVKDRRPPRFSLSGNDEGDESAVQDVEVFRNKLEKGAVSPGELSHVTTAPPTPKDTPEETRRASIEEKEETVSAAQHQATPESVPLSPAAPADDFPMDDDGDDDDDDDDDLLPPPPPEDEEDEMEPEAPVDPVADDVEFPTEVDDEKSVASSTGSLKAQEDVASVRDDSTISTESVVSVKIKKKVIVEEEEEDDDDDDDDDKEGPGFEMTASPEAEASPKSTSSEAGNKKKRGRPRKDSIDDEVTPVKRGRKKKAPVREKTLFSPPGRPIGPREMEPVPVSDYKETPPRGVRRSGRAKIAPLAYWKNERTVYGPHNEKGRLADEMGCMPVVHSVLQARATPRKLRKVTFSAATKKPRNAAAAMVEEVTEFDSKRLRKKYQYLDGENANIWDEAMEDAGDQKVVSYVDRLTVTDLPLPARKRGEGTNVGKAAQSFNVQSGGDNGVMVGYIMGNLLLPPKGIKDPESTGACSQVFTVCSCQPKAIEIAYGDPHEEEGSLNADTAQRFLLSAGDQFRIPPGNAYRLHNHSTTTDALFAWTIIRPRVNE